MVAKNDITGDAIQSRLNNEDYAKNYDSIFKEKIEFLVTSDGTKYQKCSKRCWLEIKDDKPSCNKLNKDGTLCQEYLN